VKKKTLRDELIKQALNEINPVDIVEYVQANYDTLGKSSFNGQEIVIVLEIRNDDEGYGNHSYEGVGVDGDGKVFYCFSSGCSCTGECGIEGPHGHDLTLKKFEVNGNAFDLSNIDVETLKSIQVDFNDY